MHIVSGALRTLVPAILVTTMARPPAHPRKPRPRHRPRRHRL